MSSITAHLAAVREGKPGAEESLLSEVYDILHQIAASRLSRQGSRITLHPTELVNEAWIRLRESAGAEWENRTHFFCAAAEAMRRTLVDKARYKQRLKRGGQFAVRYDLDQIDLVAPEPEEELLHLNEALAAFEATEPLKARVVKLKFFCGMTIDEISAATELSCATVERYWAYSRVWLQQRMERDRSTDTQQEY
jgi:RNA polymerase sigma factor (TIGR02999 family)